MIQASAISVLTLIVSAISVHTSTRFIRKLSCTHLLEYGDHATRGAILAFLVCVLFPECYHHMGMTATIMGITTFLVILNGVDSLYKNLCNKSLLKDSPWYLYSMLLPHCCIEGLAISPYLHDNTLNLSLVGFFLLHKTTELAMIALSTEAHNMSTLEKRCILNVFIFSTPLCMIAGMLLQSYLHELSFLHDGALILSAAIFLHLALFCQFCSCQHKQRKPLFQPIFFSAFMIVAVILASMGPSCPNHHHHHHEQTHHHNHQ